MPIPAALAASIASAVVSTAGNIALSERQRQKNEQYQQQMNEYNLPKNQVQRLMDAGINPNALSMSSGINVPGNTSAGINPYTTPSLADPMSLISNSFLQMAQGDTENQLREVRKLKVAEEIENLRANSEKLGVDAEYQSILNVFAAAREEAAIRGENTRSDLSVWQTKKVKEEARQLARYIDEQMPAEISKIIADKNLTVGQLDLVIATIANTNADTSLKGAQQQLAEHQVDVADTQAALNVEQRGLTAQESSNYQDLTNAILAHYQATINNIMAQTGKTEQEAFYYLYELSMKYKITLKDFTPGYGGIYNMENAAGLSQQAREKYGFKVSGNQ